MAVDNLQIVDIIEVMENFLEKRRPPEHVRARVDLVYDIDGQSVILNEVRPVWNKPEMKTEHGIAKATFVKASNHWKIFWLRADLKWHAYSPVPTVDSLKAFTEVVDADANHCFWG